MAAVVPSQFLFTADPTAGVILGFKINRDGGLSPVPGSPFVSDDSPRLVATLQGHLLVAGKGALAAFAVNKASGTLTQTDSRPMPLISDLEIDASSHVAFATEGSRRIALRLEENKIQITSASEIMPFRKEAPIDSMTGKTVVDITGQFSYAIDSSKGQISSSRVEDGKIVLLTSYPAGHGAVSLAITVP